MFEPGFQNKPASGFPYYSLKKELANPICFKLNPVMDRNPSYLNHGRQQDVNGYHSTGYISCGPHPILSFNPLNP